MKTEAKRAGTWCRSFSRLCVFLAYKFLLGTSLLLSLLHSLLSSGFILADQGVFCQVSPIKFALRGPSRTLLLRDSDHERNGSSHKNFTLAASKRFSQLFFSASAVSSSPSYFSLFSLFSIKIFVVYASHDEIVTCRISTIFWLVRWFRDAWDR